MSITTVIRGFNRIITVLPLHIAPVFVLLFSAVAAAAINPTTTITASSLDSDISLSDIKEVKNYICPGKCRIDAHSVNGS
jgi:hypothetical protein